MIKRISLIRRKAGMSWEDFLAHWTGPHAAIVRQLPGLQRMRFGVVRRCSSAKHSWDGVGELWFESMEEAERAFACERVVNQLIDDRPKFMSEACWLFVEEYEVPLGDRQSDPTSPGGLL